MTFTLSHLRELLDKPDIIGRVDEIEPVIAWIEEHHINLLQEAVNMIKDAVQSEAEQAMINHPSGKGGIAAMATGTGKSKIPINFITNHFEHRDLNRGDILLIVPTEKLRDENWMEEFYKWNASHYYDKVERTCYASLKNYKGRHFKFVIGDEWHNMTIDKEEFFSDNQIDMSFMLTATPTKDQVKIELNKRLGYEVAYYVPLDVAVKLRLVSPYEITIVECTLDNTTKNIPAGNKDKPFMQTEQAAYEYKEKLVRMAMFAPPASKLRLTSNMRVFQRRNFILNLPSKTENAKFILQNIIPQEARTLIFTGSIDQAIALCPHRFHSKVSAKKTDRAPKKARAEKIMAEYQGDESLNLFMSKAINQMACVEALNEGVNIPDLDYILVVQLNSSDKDILQRIGRLIRYRIGHIGRVIILVVKNTQDEKWLNTALEGFDQSKIRRVHISNIISGNDVLFKETV